MVPSQKGGVRLRRLLPLAMAALAVTLAGCASNSGSTGARRSAAATRSYDPPGPPSDPWGPYIREASQRFDVPERWIREVMRQESGGRAGATSPVGAMGLMQVMPGTYAELRNRYDLGSDAYHPYDSIMAGTAYIREMYDLYGSPAFLAAYNAGPRRLEDYLWASRGLPTETRNYVARIGPRIEGASPTRRAPPEVYAAADIPTSIPPGPRRMNPGTMLALREQRRQQIDAAPAIQVAQLPPGPVIRMEPVDSASAPAPYQPAPYQVASLAVPPPGAVIRMDPIPDGSTPEGAARLAESRRGEEAPDPAPVAEPPRRGRFAGSAFAAAPLPAPEPRGHGGRNAPIVMAALPVPPAQPPSRYAPAPAAAPRSGGLGIIGTAQASTLPAASRGGGGRSNWAVQVGAFSSENVARNAAGQMRDQIALLGSRTDIQPLAQGRTRLYRARVTGLSRDAAESACARLRARGNRDCAVVAPGA
jgi:hypothetical protein